MPQPREPPFPSPHPSTFSGHSSPRPVPLFLSHVLPICFHSLLLPPHSNVCMSSRSFPGPREPGTNARTLGHVLLINRRFFGFDCLTIHRSLQSEQSPTLGKGWWPPFQSLNTPPHPTRNPGLRAPARSQQSSNSRAPAALSRQRAHLAGGHPPGDLGSLCA